MPKLNSLEVVHQDTNKDSYETLHDIIVGLKGSQNQEVVDGEARALYEALLEMYVNDKEAFARRIETLKAEFGDSLAQVVEEMLAYASQSEAYAKKITTVSAEVANSNAMVQTEMYARATADEALAQLITTLEATVNSNTAAITSEATARANADSALASQITTLSATVGSKNRTYYQSTEPSSGMVSGDLWIDSDDDKLYRYNGSSWVNIQDNDIAANIAAISNEATVRATADSANATAINALTARLDTGDFATVKTTSEASALKLQTRANLVSEITNWTLNGGLALDNTGNGLIATSPNSGSYTGESPFFPATPGQVYTITGDTRKQGTAGSVYFNIAFYDSSGNVLKWGAANPISNAHIFSYDDTNRNALAVSDTAPIGTTQAKARFVADGVDSNGAAFRQVKVERGGLPATPFSQETTVNYASAKWGVTVDANGNAAGIALMANSTGTSEFVVAANKFRVKKPDGTDGISWNGTNSRLDISGDVYANAFYGNVIGTNNVNTKAITENYSLFQANYDVTLSFNVSGLSTDVYDIFISSTWTQSYTASTSLYFDGWLVRNEMPSGGTLGTLTWAGSIGPGSHSVRLYINDSRNVQGTSIYVLVTKR